MDAREENAATEGAGKATDLVALGELLVDFTQCGTSEHGGALFERNAGGAPANVLVAASKLGLATQFVGKVGADAHGRFLHRALEEQGVGCIGLVEDPDVFTTLAFVEVDSRTGERTFSFARKPGADTRLTPDEIPLRLVQGCRVLHVGSLSLTDEPARSATMCAVDAAGDAGALISYDPNYRPALWPSEQAALDEMAPMLGQADLVKLSLEEACMLCGTHELPEIAAVVTARGVSLVAVTLGADGAFLATRHAQASVPACACHAVDTTGAGDAFWGAALAWLIRERNVRTPTDVEALTCEDLAACGHFACAAAACCVELPGGIPAMPTREQVEERARG